MPKTYTDAERLWATTKVIVGLRAGVPLVVACSEEGMPCDNTIRSWAEDDVALGEAIARAREAGFDTIAARMRATARGKGEAEGGDSSGDVQRDKLIIDTDLKLLAKWDPKRYGELVKHAGPNGDDPIPSAVSVSFVKTDAPREN